MPLKAEIIPYEPGRIMLPRDVDLLYNSTPIIFIGMNIYCNGKQLTVDSNASLHSLLVTTEFANQKGIAVAVNNSVVKKQDWESHLLSENDKVLIVSATKGG